MYDELKIRWVEALRSGKYKQGKERLKYKNEKGKYSYCCLGVLCELTNSKFAETTDHTNKTVMGVGIDKSYTYPTTSMRKKWGLNETMMHTLAEMNDDGKSFKQLANYIEKNVN